MKRYLKDFKFSTSFIEKCIYECLNSKWNRRDTVYFISKYAQIWLKTNKGLNLTIQEVRKLVRKQIKIDKTKLFKIINYIAEELYQEIYNKKISLSPIRYDERFDGKSNKIRKIGTSSIKQQIYDYIVVNACKSMFNAKIGYYQCASLKNKGQLFGKKTIETWIRTNPKKCKYIFKCDIKKYYPSVEHTKLKDLLKRDIKNDAVLFVLYTLIDTYEEGLCIGSYLCQYLANYYLSYAYHYVSENLYTERRGKRQNLVHHVLFYMDDIILFGSSKKNIKIASKKLEEYLDKNLGLRLKPTYQLFKLDSRPIDMLGYKIYTYKTTIRKAIFRRANRVILKIKRNKFKINLTNAYKIVSYYGYFKYTFSKKYSNKVKLEKIFQISKGVISNAKKNSFYREATCL